MSHSGNIVSLFVTLFICTLDGYSMMNYRVPTKRAYGYFAAVTAVCLAFNLISRFIMEVRCFEVLFYSQSDCRILC